MECAEATPPPFSVIDGASTVETVASPLASPCSAMYASMSAAAFPEAASLMVKVERSLDRGVFVGSSDMDRFAEVVEDSE